MDIEETFRLAIKTRIEQVGHGEQARIARKAELNPSTLSNILSGARGSKEWQRRAIAHAAGLNYEEIIGSGGAVASGSAEVEPSNVAPHYSPYPSRQVPVISWVQAGDWQTVSDPYHPGAADDWVNTSATNNPHAFALRVVGDSMEPKFQEGDVIVVDPDRPAGNGKFIIAKNGHEATFKQLVIDGSNVYLKPLNSRYPIRDMTGVEFKIVGVVVQRITDL